VLSGFNSKASSKSANLILNEIKGAMKKVKITAAVEPVAKVFEQLGILYYIGGSVASSVYGMPRATQGVDMVTNFNRLITLMRT
jgi:hypothetical protein